MIKKASEKALNDRGTFSDTNNNMTVLYLVQTRAVRYLRRFIGLSKRANKKKKQDINTRIRLSAINRATTRQ